MANNTVEILNSINKTVATIAANMAPKNGTGKEATAKLSQGNIAAGSAETGTKASNLSSTSLKDFIKIIGGLPVSVKAVAELSGKTIKNFENVMKTVTKIMVELDKNGKKIDKKNIENALMPMTQIVQMNKSFSKMVLLAPLATAGALLTYPVVVTYIGILKLVEKFGGGNKAAKAMKQLTKSIKPMIRMVEESVVLLAICAGLGVAVAAGGGKIILSGIAVLGATLLALTAVIGIVGLAGKLLKNTGAIEGTKEIMRLTWASIGLVAACLALGALVAMGDTEKILLNGLAILGGTLLTLTLIIGLTGLASRLMKATGAIKGVKEIMILTMASIGLVALCVGLGAVVAQGDTQKILLNGLAILGGTLLALGAIILLAGLLGVVIKESKAMSSVKSIIILTLASMAIIVAAKYLGDFAAENSKSILKGLALTGGVMVALIGIGLLAGKLLSGAKKGIAALAVIELLAFGAMGVVYVASKLADELNGRYKEVIKALGLTLGVLTAFGALAALASFIMPEILLGSLALGAAELMAVGAIAVVGKIIDLDKKKDEIGVSWKQLAKDVLGINGVIAAFGLTAAAFSLLTIPILIATPALALTIMFANKAIGVVRNIVDVTEAIDKVGGIDRVSNTLNRDIPRMMKGFKKKNFDTDMSLFTIARLSIKYAALARLGQSLLVTASSISKIANIGTMTEGGLIRPALSVDKETGKIIYGDPVDIKGVSKVICDTLRIFVENMDYNFKDLAKMVIGAKMFELMGTITTPISTFLEMLTGYVGGTNDAGAYTLTPVRIDSEGKITYGAPVPVKDTAITIANAVGAFVSELYSEENAGKWSEMVYGDRTAWQKFWGSTNKKTDAVKEIGGILGLFVSPVADFVECISKFQSAGPGHLTLLTVDSEGNVKSGGDIDVAAVAKVIGGSITTFITEIFQTPATFAANVNTSIIEVVVSKVNNVSKAFAELSTNNNIDPKKLSSLYANFNEGADAITHVSTSISAFDSIINKEKEKRKKNIKELGDSIDELLNKFKDLNGIESLYNLIKTLQTMDATKISNNLNLIRGGAGSTPSNPSGGNGGSVGGGLFGGGNRNTLTKQDIIDAISTAMDGLVLTGGSSYEESTNSDGINALINALKSIDLNINIAK